MTKTKNRFILILSRELFRNFNTKMVWNQLRYKIHGLQVAIITGALRSVIIAERPRIRDRQFVKMLKKRKCFSGAATKYNLSLNETAYVSVKPK